MENQSNAPAQIQINTMTPNTRNYIPGLFGIAALLFIFNFCELGCQGQRFATVTGIELVTGTEIEEPKQQNPFGFNDPSEEKSRKMAGNMWAVIALAAAVAGLIIFLIRHKQEDIVGAIAGVAGAVSLLLLKGELTASITAEGRGMITVEFLFPFWGSFLALASAGTMSFLRSKQSRQQQENPQPGQTVPTPPLFSPPEAAPIYQAQPLENYSIPPPIQQTIPPPPVQATPEPVAPLVVQNFSIPPIEQHQNIPFHQEAPKLPVTRVAAPNYPQTQKTSNWIIWLVLMEVSPGLFSGSIPDKNIDKPESAEKISKKNDAKTSVTPVNNAAENSDLTASLGYVQTLYGSDLRMRAAPSESSTIVMSIPNASPVIIMGYDDHDTTVNGESGRWCKIKHNGKIGWAWGKFIIKK
jgi:Bacterial SH3 domain